jgi:signal transduction histidine kinase
MNTGMAFLPQWLLETKDPAAWESLLSEWVRAAQWRSAGVVWPYESQPTLAQLARSQGVETLPALPAEIPDVARALKNGPSTVVWQLPGSAGRLYTLLQPAGRPQGLIWAERVSGEPWTEIDRHFLVLSTRMIERSSALANRIGPIVDPERLLHRINDAAVIAGRMAHDFDNILTGIIGFSDLTAPLVSKIPQAGQYISEINKVGQRGIQFTRQLHQLSRSAQVKNLPGNISSALAKEETRLRTANPNNVRIENLVPSQLPQVAMEALPLGTVLGHLLDNAIEASPPNGRVVVMARTIELTPTEARSYLGSATAGGAVEISIQDFGSGIKPEHRSRIFAEPFYTTKVRHRGLGLAIVYRTLSAHGGGIRLDSASAPDQGTIVRIVLRLAVQRPEVIVNPHHTIVTQSV